MEARLILIFNSADFFTRAQGQSVFKKYIQSSLVKLSVNFFPIAFVPFLFADISAFFSLVDGPWKGSESF